MAIDAGGLAGKYLTQELGSRRGGEKPSLLLIRAGEAVGFSVYSTQRDEQAPHGCQEFRCN